MSPDQRVASPASASAMVAAMASGDENALGSLYDAFGAVAYGLAYAITGTHAKAEAAVASAFADAWRSAGAFDASRTSVLAWLTGLVRRSALVQTPPDRHRPDSAATSGAPTPVGRALRALTEPQRRALELSYYAGLSVSEIAARLGVPESGTRELLRTAMNDLRSALSPTGTFDDQAMTRA